MHRFLLFPLTEESSSGDAPADEGALLTSETVLEIGDEIDGTEVPETPLEKHHQGVQ